MEEHKTTVSEKNNNHATQPIKPSVDEQNHATVAVDHHNIHETSVVNEKPAQNEKLNIAINIGDVLPNGYKITRLLSNAGGEAVIFVCEKAQKEYVTKAYRNGREPNKALLEQILSINYRYIMKPIDKGIYKNVYYEINPYYKNGTLADHLKDLTDDFIKEVIVKEVNEGLHDIHQTGIFHNDIKPSNIFFTDDMSHIVIGDFGVSVVSGGAHYRTAIGQTPVFSAPEAVEIATIKTDYFAFGMTLIFAGYKGDPFVGISDALVRKEILSASFKVPKSIEKELFNLIYMLTLYNPEERIGYEGVKQWVNDHHLYSNAADMQNEYYKLKRVFRYNHKEYNNGYELAVDMSENWQVSLDYLENGFIETFFRDNGSADDIITLKEYRNNHTPDESLFYILHLINPTLPFTYQNNHFINFNGYLDFLTNNYKTQRKLLASSAVIETVLNIEKMDKQVITSILDILNNSKTTEEEKVDLIINLTKKTEKLFDNGVIYQDLKEYVSCLYNDKMGLNPSNLLHNRIFLNILVNNYNIPKETINKMLEATDEFDFIGYLSFTVFGFLHLKYNNTIFKTIDDFFNFAILNRNLTGILKLIGEWLSDGKIIKYMNFYKDISQNLNKTITDISVNKNTSCLEKGKMFYYLTKNSKYITYDNVLLGDLNELIEYLNKAKDKDLVSDYILKDITFKYWFKLKGYQI